MAHPSDTDPRVVRSRARLLGAATALLVEGGPRGVTVDAVAERSGVAKSTLYRHWSSREELLVEVLRSNMPQIGEVDLTVGFEAALRRHVDDVVRTFADPEWSRILPALFMLQNQLREVEDITHDDREQKLGVLAEILELGVAEGTLSPDVETSTAAAALFGPLMFVALTGEGDLARVASFAVDRFLDGRTAH